MNTSARVVALAGTILALSAVILAAMGSHLFDMNGLQGIWQTASNIHLFNSAALLGLAALLVKLESHSLKWGAWLIVLGTVVFCGSIYLHVITGLTMSGVAPSGGLLMMAGWLLAIFAFLRKS
ncbi:MAG: DUF423 domain-containing protein [Lysobacterales bacterium]|jgi:uncharacterized membrane protein YgdD (TMEM256/DUF423 family)